MKNLLGIEWYDKLYPFIEKGELSKIARVINYQRSIGKQVIPEKGSITMFRAFKETSFTNTKVVILGQDPYYSYENGIPVFDGLAFSNSNSYKASPSLHNILEEIAYEYYCGLNLKTDYNLSLFRWAQQGVLLLNTAHTVIKNSPGAHLHIWKPFTEKVIEVLNTKKDLVWLLWGAKAIEYEKYITNTSHAIICTSHPSPLGYKKELQKKYPPFYRSNCFINANDALYLRNINKINWL